jgi:hypothetical protein
MVREREQEAQAPNVLRPLFYSVGSFLIWGDLKDGEGSRETPSGAVTVDDSEEGVWGRIITTY